MRRRRPRGGSRPDAAKKANKTTPVVEDAPGESRRLLDDPTSNLLRTIEGVESKVPWVPLGIALLCLLWLPVLSRLESEPVRPAEAAWVAEALTPWEDGATGSAFSRALSRATWEWQGAEIESGDLNPSQRLRARIPSVAAGLAALFVFYLLARLVVGNAAALLAACLLAIAPPWVRAGTSVLPLMVGEMLVLLGVVWALSLQGRHREVQLAGVTAARIGIAGVFLGVGLLLAPAAFATFTTTLLIWFLLGLRRSSSDATTLPVGKPAETTFYTVFGTVALCGAALLAGWLAERVVGGASNGLAALLPAGPHGASVTELWVDAYRRLLSPGPRTDLLMSGTLLVILVVRAIEWTAGRPWKAAGLLPWIFLVAWVLALRSDGARATLDLPITVPPLFVLGFGWLLLRGLRPGVVRRQEYTFLLTWLLMSVLLLPLVPGRHPHDPLLAAAVVLLPPAVLIAGRGARAMWEAQPEGIARLGILIIAYVPVVVLLLRSLDKLSATGVPLIGTASRQLEIVLPWIILGAALLGILAEFVRVRPDAAPAHMPTMRRGGRRGRRPGGRRSGRRTGRRRGGSRS